MDRCEGIASKISGDSDIGFNHVFDPLLEEIESMLDEIRFDIETLEAGPDSGDFYEEICNDLHDAEVKVQKAEKVVAYYELHNTQKEHLGTLFSKIRNTVSELTLAFDFEIDLDVIPITWNETALVIIVPESVYGLWIPPNITEDSFAYFAPLIAHEAGHVTTDYRDVLLPDAVNTERKRIAKEFGRGDEDRERMVAEALSFWYEELYCDTIGALTFGPAYLVGLSRWLFSDNPYELPSGGSVDSGHPPDELRYRNVCSVVESEYSEELLQESVGHCNRFTEHLDKLEKKKKGTYDHWFSEQYLEAIREDAREFVKIHSTQLKDAIQNPEQSVSSELAIRAEVNREMF